MAAPTKAELAKVKKLRSEGLGWKEVMDQLDKPIGFVHAVRKADRSLVSATGRNAPGYGKNGVKSTPKAKSSAKAKATAKSKASSKKATAKRSTKKATAKAKA